MQTPIHPLRARLANRPVPRAIWELATATIVRIRILTRYILGEVVSHALIGAAVFTFILFTRDLGRILELVVRNSAPLPSIAEIFFYTIPVALTYTIPMGVLVGILIGLSRLSADSEVTAMRASGFSVWSFLRVCSIFVILAWLLALANSVYIAPMSMASLGNLQNRLESSQASFEVQPRVFYEGFPKIVLYVQDVKAMAGGALWKGVFLADLSDPAAPRITLAKQGLLVSQSASIARPSPHRRFHPRGGSEESRSISDLHFSGHRHSNPGPGRAKPPAKRVGFPERNDARATASKRAHRTMPTRAAGRRSSFIVAWRCPRLAWCLPWSAYLWDCLQKRAGSRVVLSSPFSWCFCTTRFR